MGHYEDGLWVCAKRLEKGRFTWPQSGDAQGKVILSHEELSLLLGGIDLTKTKHKRWYRKASPDPRFSPGLPVSRSSVSLSLLQLRGAPGIS